MIAYVKGTLAHKDGTCAVIEASGIGYRLQMSAKSLAALPALGQQAIVWTCFQVKDDAISLYGFANQAEEELFRRLTSVSGIGPKIALAALSSFDAPKLAALIAEGDVTAVSTVPGIGKKTAQRIVLELQGVLQLEDPQPQAAFSQGVRDACEALVSMGFSREEALSALEGQPADASASALVKTALHVIRSRS